MSFYSILFLESEEGARSATSEAPHFFRDLNLDQIVEAVTADWKDYELAPFYYTPPKNLDAVTYRQEIMQDLEDTKVMQAVRSFSEKMQTMRRLLGRAKELNYQRRCV